jgi:hypothetical protein
MELAKYSVTNLIMFLVLAPVAKVMFCMPEKVSLVPYYLTAISIMAGN